MVNKQKLFRFTIRIYGIWIDKMHKILLTDEWIEGKLRTKFPGGGLIPGESTKDGLIREWMEELGMEIKIISHYYTTDILVPSFKNDGTQVISIYYLVEPVQKDRGWAALKEQINVSDHDDQSFRMVALKGLDVKELDFPIDRVVCGMLKKKENNF